MSIELGKLSDITVELKFLGHQIQDTARLNRIVEYLQNADATLGGTAARSPREVAKQDMRQALLSLHVKRGDLKTIIRSGISTAFGSKVLSDPHVHAYFKMWKDLFRIDLAYSMMTRDLRFQECHIRFGWCDGSPQGLYDFLIWKYKFVKASDLLRVSAAVAELSLTKGGSLGEAIESDDDGEIHLGVAAIRAAANKVLESSVHDQVCVPVTQGQGSTSAADKISAASHMHSVESYDIRQMIQGLEEYQSFTSDLGTDVKFTEFAWDKSDPSKFMPSWLAEREYHAPMQVDDVGQDDAVGGLFQFKYHNPLIGCKGKEILPNALPIPGAGHTIHNSMKHVPENMAHWSKFFNDLKVIEQLMTHPGRRERMVAQCVTGTPFAEHKKELSNCSAGLYEKRWGEVAGFCRKAVRPIAILRRCWSEKDYEENGKAKLLERQWGDDTGGFKPSEVTRVLHCPLFRHYLLMVIKLHAVSTRFMKWLDGCPCHQGLLLAASTLRSRAKKLKRDGLSNGNCPLASCRGWEIVDGKVESVLKELCDAVQEELLEAIEIRSSDGVVGALSAGDLSILMNDYVAGTTCLQAAMSVRLAWGKSLPWLLIGMAHPVKSRALHWASECIRVYESAPAAQQHHRKTLLFLQGGGVLRQALDDFIQSGTMPDVLCLHTAVFRLIPLGDRQIEMEHKPVSDIVAVKRGVSSGHHFSIQRYKVVEALLESDGANADKLADHFTAVKSISGAVRALKFNLHPVFKDVFKLSDKTWGK